MFQKDGEKSGSILKKSPSYDSIIAGIFKKNLRNSNFWWELAIE